MACCERKIKLTIVGLIFEIVIIVCFGVFVRYDDKLGMPTKINETKSSNGEGEVAETALTHIEYYYPMFQDIHVMMFIGFGFLMTFLKKYGFSSVGLNFLVAAFVLQWATLVSGWIRHYD
jgi:ammonium transporter Rh